MRTLYLCLTCLVWLFRWLAKRGAAKAAPVAVQPQPVEQTKMFNLSTLTGVLSAVFQSVNLLETVAADTAALYKSVNVAIATAETVYKDQTGAGAAKLAAVMAAAESAAAGLSVDWASEAANVKSYVTQAISIYNSVSGSGATLKAAATAVATL